MPTRADRVVVDTNVLISAALRGGSAPRRVLHAIQTNGGVLLFANETFDELRSRLLRPKFDRYVTPQGRLGFLGQVISVSEWVAITGATLGCRDPDDDRLLEAALLGEATCLVTGDRDLLAMNPFRGIPVLAPAVFLADLSGPTPIAH